MSAKFSRIHHLLQTCLWVCLCVVCSAYTTAFSLDSWLSEFVQLRVEQKDSAMPLMKIAEHYRSLNKSGQKEIKDKLTLATSSYLTQNKQEEALAVIDLYNYMVEEKDDSWSRLNFVKGNIAAERNDTLTLKRIISELESIEGDTYAPQLKKHLKKIRNFVPADKRLSGYWVSDKLFTNIYEYFFNLPYYFFYVPEDKDKTIFEIMTQSIFVSRYGSVVPTYDPFTQKDLRGNQVSQVVIPYAEDSVYIAWSSEALKNIDADMSTSLRKTTHELSSQVSGYFSQSNKFSFAEQMTANVATGLVEIGLNALFDKLTEPSKRLYLLEARLKRVSDYELQGTFTLHSAKVKASDKEIKFKVETEEITLYKYFPETKLAFIGNTYLINKNGKMVGAGVTLEGYPYPYPYTLGTGKLKKYKKMREQGKVEGLHWEEFRDDTTTLYGKAWLQYKSLKKKKERKEFLKEFNNQQMERIKQYAREQARLKKEKEEKEE